MPNDTIAPDTLADTVTSAFTNTVADTKAHAADAIDELAAFGQSVRASEPARALTDLVERNPIPAVLAAAAAGAGLMALAALMARRDPEPRIAMPQITPLTSPRVLDYDALKQQIADLADRVTRAVPVDAAKQRVEDAGDVLADGWATVRAQALDALGRFEPQASAAIKVARENPGWTALAAGVLGALLGSQMLGGKAVATVGPQSDPSADA